MGKTIRTLMTALCLAMLSSLQANAQGTVYFGSLDNKVSIGFGRGSTPNEVIFSTMQESKHKDFDKFSLTFIDKDENLINVNMEKGQVYHLDVDKNTFFHQADYKMSRMEFNKLCKALDSQSSVIVNESFTYNGSAVVGLIRSLEIESETPFRGNVRVDRVPWMQNNMMMLVWMNRNKGRMRFIRQAEPKQPQ